jgi:hypothetical protein
MSVYDDFFTKYSKAMDSKSVPSEIVEKYKNILPEPIIRVWENHGFGGYRKGLFWTINPDEYNGYLEKWIKTKWNDVVPIMRTAFGDIIVMYNIDQDDDEWEDVGFRVIDLKHGDEDLVTNGLEKFFKRALIRTGMLVDTAQIDLDLFFYGVDNLGLLKADECYGFEPLLLSGGKENEESMTKLNFSLHLDIMTQALPKPAEF